MPSKVALKLSSQPDGFGFFYGRASLGDAVVSVNILPPAPLWRGDMKLPDHPPDPTKWIIFADGDEIARVERRENLGDALVPLLTVREGEPQ